MPATEFRPSITMADFKNIFEKDSMSKQNFIEVLQNKINVIIAQEEDFDLDEEILENELYTETIIDSVIYYVAGFIIKSVIRTTNCCTCISSLKNSEMGPENLPDEANLTLIKTRGALVHPSSYIYYLLRKLERFLSEHIDTNDVYDSTLQDFLNNCSTFKFECKSHESYVLASLFHNFILLRMRFYSKQRDVHLKKESREKKKLSKLCSK